MNWFKILGPYVGYLVAFASIVFTYFDHRSTNKSLERMELTKQKFAKENEQIKRKQYQQDKKIKLIGNFLADLNSYPATFLPKDRQKLLNSSGQLMPFLKTQEARDLVSQVVKAVNKIEFPDETNEQQGIIKMVETVNTQFSRLMSKEVKE